MCLSSSRQTPEKKQLNYNDKYTIKFLRFSSLIFEMFSRWNLNLIAIIGNWEYVSLNNQFDRPSVLEKRRHPGLFLGPFLSYCSIDRAFDIVSSVIQKFPIFKIC